MANEAIDHLRPRDFMRENSVGGDASLYVAFSGDIPCLTFPKLADQGYVTTVGIAGLTVATGITLHIFVTDDGSNAADLGKVVRLGFTLKRMIDGETLDLDAGASAEATKDITLAATTGQLDVSTLAIANAAMDSTVTNEAFALRVRRIGTASQDTCNGRILLACIKVVNT